VKLTNQGESKRGRPRKISYSLIRRLAGHLHAGCDIRTACNLCQVGEQTYRDWRERAENNEEPYAKLFSVASRARDGFKTQLLKIVVDAARTDAKFACWMLERGWPLEYAAFDRRPVPQPPPSLPDLSSSIRITCGGVDVGEYMRLKGELRTIEAELKAIGALPDFPMVDASSTAPGEPGSSDDHTIQNKSGGERPIVGDGERVIGWTDEADVEADLP